MKALFTLFLSWRPRLAWLCFGAIMAVCAMLANFLLMCQSGGRLAWAILGSGLGLGGGFLLLRLAGLSRIILRYLERLLTHDAMFRALSGLRVWFYRKLAFGSAAGLGFKRSADILTRLVTDIQSLDGVYLRIFLPILTAAFALPVIVVFCLYFGILAACIVGGIFAFIAFILPCLTYGLTKRTGPGLQEARANLHVHALDMATGLRETRIFGAEKRFAEKLEARQNDLYQHQTRQSVRLILARMLAMLLGRFAIIFILCCCIGLIGLKYTIIGQSFTGGETALAISLVFVLLTSFDIIADLPGTGLLAGEAGHAAARILDVTNPPQGVIKAESGKKPFPTNYSLRFENVSFGWKPNRKILHDISFTLAVGKHMALTGPSGAGKSSLAALLLKVATPESGRIMIGEDALEEIAPTSLRRNMAWLSQSSHLFSDTLRNNLLLGRKNIPEDRLWLALEQAQIADFVRTLPQGLDQWIGENGSTVSGGQGRRIALARALLSDSSILVLDEPAAGLDLETELAFLHTLNHISVGKSLVLITHRLTGIENLDYHYRLDDGKMTQEALQSHRSPNMTLRGIDQCHKAGQL